MNIANILIKDIFGEKIIKQSIKFELEHSYYQIRSILYSKVRRELSFDLLKGHSKNK